MSTAGSTAVIASLEALRSGQRSAHPRLLAQLVQSWDDEDGSFDEVLDEVAAMAGGGNRAAMELVLTVVHQLQLARPAILRLIVDPVTVGEVAQLTLIQVERGLPRFESRSRFRTWLFTVARNEALMYLRGQSRRAAPDDLTTGGEVSPGGPHLSSVVATRATVEAALDALPEPYRATLILRFIHRLDYAEIAQELDVPVGTVRSRISKGRHLLTEALAQP